MIGELIVSVVFAANVFTNPELKSVNTQVIHGDPMLVLEEREEAYKVLANGTDEGWVKKSDTAPFEPLSNILKIDSLKAHIYQTPSVMDAPPIISLPYGASVESLNERIEKWLKVAYLTRGGKKEGWIQEMDTSDALPLLDADRLVSFAERFLERPYTWGGLSSDGLDCSGLIKIVMLRRNIELPHSAIKQAEFGQKVEKEDLKRGDLIFFKRNERIMHVALYRGDGTFIHASANETGRPSVRINRLDDPFWQAHYAFSKRL
ncbi:MAG: NlpC/P60 family protein [Parachlamydiaceae bacterium]